MFAASVRDSLGFYLARGFEEREVARTPWGEEVVVCERALRVRVPTALPPNLYRQWR